MSNTISKNTIMKAELCGIQFGNIKNCKYTISQSKQPIYQMGSVNPVSFTRGIKYTTGILSFSLINSRLIASAISNYTIKNTTSSIYIKNNMLPPINILFIDGDTNKETHRIVSCCLLQGGSNLYMYELVPGVDFAFTAEDVKPFCTHALDKNEPIDTDGMIYNPYSDSWSWI